jgi:hypothetical protein
MHKITIYPLLTHTRQKPIEVYAPNLFKLAHAVFKITHSANSTYKHLGYIKTFEETAEDVIVQAHKNGKVIDIMRIHTTEIPSEGSPEGLAWN